MAIRQGIAQEAYSDRNETLRLLGFPSYGSYLRSQLWQIVRARALEIKGNVCQKCKGEARTVHHATYTRAVLIGEDVQGLVPLCSWCHKKGSLTIRGSKAKEVDGLRVRHLADTNAWLIKHKEPRKCRPRTHWCSCGRMRKAHHKVCRFCRRQKH